MTCWWSMTNMPLTQVWLNLVVNTWTQGLGSLTAEWSGTWVSEGKVGSRCSSREHMEALAISQLLSSRAEIKEKNPTLCHAKFYLQSFSRISFYNPGIIQGRTCLWLKSCWPYFWMGCLPCSNYYYFPLCAMTGDKSAGFFICFYCLYEIFLQSFQNS